MLVPTNSITGLKQEIGPLVPRIGTNGLRRMELQLTESNGRRSERCCGQCRAILR